MEGNIKASKRDHSETTLKDNMTITLPLFKRAVIAAIHIYL